MTNAGQTETKFYNAISLTHLVGPVRFKKMLKKLQTAENIWSSGLVEIKNCGIDEKTAEKFISAKNKINPDREFERLDKEKIKLITVFDDKYPRLLKEIYDAPFSIYIKGELPENDYRIAIVGSRKLSPYGKNAAGHIASGLAESGIVIVSGLALGIDSVAHNAAVSAKKPTIAVLGSGLDEKNIYPYCNRKLANEIIAYGGALVSEYPLGTASLRYHFPQRNRIISGLSLGTVVVEAQEKSASLITARCALEQNREVFAVPGNIFSPNSAGTNNLLKSGAKLVTKASDVLEELNLENTAVCQEAQKITGETAEENILLGLLSKSDPLYIDKLTKLSKLDSASVSATLTVMEIKGKVKNLGGMNYVLAR